MHARNKPLDRGDDDALLRSIADLAIGYSGAELANLMNEAAILAVRLLHSLMLWWFIACWFGRGLAGLMNEAAIPAVPYCCGGCQSTMMGGSVFGVRAGQLALLPASPAGLGGRRAIPHAAAAPHRTRPPVALHCLLCTPSPLIAPRPGTPRLPPQVRRSQSEIDLPVLKEAMDKIRLGEGL